MDLRYHGPFPPKVGSGTPGTIEAKPKQDQTKQQEVEYEPSFLLQAWSEPREGGKIAYLFLMYALQVPPYEAAQRIVRYFKLNPMLDRHHIFVECTPPNNELLRPIYTKFNFEWEWRDGTYAKRGYNWIWQSSGYYVTLPYSETPITTEEETQYAQQLEQLMIEAEKENTPTLPQPLQRLLLPRFSRSSGSGQLAIAETAQAKD